MKNPRPSPMLGLLGLTVLTLLVGRCTLASNVSEFFAKLKDCKESFDHPECCVAKGRADDGREALIMRKSFQDIGECSIVLSKHTNDMISGKLKSKDLKFPEECCKVKALEPLCEEHKDQPEKLDELARDDFRALKSQGEEFMLSNSKSLDPSKPTVGAPERRESFLGIYLNGGSPPRTGPIDQDDCLNTKLRGVCCRADPFRRSETINHNGGNEMKALQLYKARSLGDLYDCISGLSSALLWGSDGVPPSCCRVLIFKWLCKTPNKKPTRRPTRRPTPFPDDPDDEDYDDEESRKKKTITTKRPDSTTSAPKSTTTSTTKRSPTSRKRTKKPKPTKSKKTTTTTTTTPGPAEEEEA